jgi:hypothetical protein
MLTLNPLYFESLVQDLIDSSTVQEKIASIDRFIGEDVFISLEVTDPYEILILKSLLVLGETSFLEKEVELKFLKPLLRSLIPTELFYQEIGGLVGYYVKVLELYLEKKEEGPLFSKPLGIDISASSPGHLIYETIKALDKLGGVFPIGGAGDRLDFRHEETGASKSLAIYPFLGRSLLEALIRDVIALEFLGEKLTGRPHRIPLFFMTSAEKNNHEDVLRCLKEGHFFGKAEEDFCVMSQPLVPVIDQKGRFVWLDRFNLSLKPGGHGAIWKIALDNKVFDWFEKKKISYLFLRQINNPICGLDYGFLAFLGEGILNKKAFGFSVCERVFKSEEGMVVRIEEGDKVSIGNIEYTDFKKRGVSDEPQKEGDLHSSFPANTNILFGNLQRIKEATSLNPHPGLLLNPKIEVEKGVMGGRLESAVQSIANEFKDNINTSTLSTYVVFNKRSKTISPIKKRFIGSILETPIGALYDTLFSAYDLFKNHLQMEIRELVERKKFPFLPVPFFILYHPALGPLYEVIAQKIKGGKIGFGAQLILEIAELEMNLLEIKGSMRILSQTLSGKCYMNRCKVFNKGVQSLNAFELLTGEIKTIESFDLKIEGCGEFFAEGVVFQGGFEVFVRDNTCVRALQKEDGGVFFVEEPLQIPSWSYFFTDEKKIELKK